MRRRVCALDNCFILKGNICHTPQADSLTIKENAYLICEGGVCRGIFDVIPEPYKNLEVIDCTGKLIIPGMTDLHTHAPQYAFCGTGMDYELMEWLNRITFPEEMLYADEEYALRAYEIFAGKVKRSAASRIVLFGTIHPNSTLILMDLMEQSGLVTYVGKVNMDWNAPPGLTEESASRSAADTRFFIEEAIRRGYQRTRPVITPRFAVSCTDELMKELGKIRKEFDLPVQSHLSENPGEIDLVRQLVPEAHFYGDAYDRFGLFGGEGNTVMAHCIYSGPEETERIKSNGVWVAHCPSSNMNLSSGIAPVRRYLEKGIRIGLGTDIGAGTSESLFRAVTDAIQVSKLYWRYIDQKAKPLSFSESFYLATKGGGSFFGKVGSFEEGYSFDALVLDDSIEPAAHSMGSKDRLERAFYQELDRNGIVMKFVDGRQIF